jgi:hypothetical protein
MPLIKLNDRSIKDVTSLPFGVGTLIHIQSQTASNSASISFTTGINSTYKEYQFYFINIHPQNSNIQFQVNFSTDGGSNYNVTKTSTFFRSIHAEDASFSGLGYRTGEDLAQSTSDQILMYALDNDNDANANGCLQLFNPSSTTYVKHFISNCSGSANDGATTKFNVGYFCAGYGNTTSAINAVKFQMSSGNIDAGTIAMFGVV